MPQCMAVAKEVALPTQHKIDQVADLTALLQDAEIAIGASYKGMPVSDLTALRRQMNANGIQVRVVKNTLLRRAAAQAGNAQFGELAQQGQPGRLRQRHRQAAGTAVAAACRLPCSWRRPRRRHAAGWPIPIRTPQAC